MTQRVRAMFASSRVLRFSAAILAAMAGAFYVAEPPKTTIAFFSAEWPPMAWGGIFVVAGCVIAWGVKTRLLPVEQLGMLILAIAAGLLSLSQTLVMLTGDAITWTRGGGTLAYWLIVLFATARYLELGADIRSAKLAQQLGSERLGGA